MTRRPCPTARSSLPPFVLLVSLLAGLMLSGQPAAAQPRNPGHRGQAAIERLGPRLPAVAARYNLAPERLRSLFLSDRYLAVDDQDRLFYVDEFLPQGPAPATADASPPLAPFPNDQTFFLHSLPGATKVILLDFDGHTTTGSFWNDSYGATIISAPFDLDGNPSSWSTDELSRIQYIWQRVAEDYLPYAVDVTTQDPGVEALRNSGSGDQRWGQRVVISPSSNWYGDYGGVAYISSFIWPSDTPCFVFSNNLANAEKYVADAASHETGHTLGLDHDGTTTGEAYYRGHNGWAPIMGVGYDQGLVQWSRGEYASANNPEDDLTLMTGYGFTFRPDDHGDSIAAATALSLAGETNVSGKGIVERPTDKDYFSFVTGAGTVTLNVTPAFRGPDLDILAGLYDSVGTLVGSSNPTALNASISASLAAGTYYLAIDGVGTGNPTTGYSDYGSLGEYNISGTIVIPVSQPPAAPSTLAATAASQTQIDLSWSDNSSDESDFHLERSPTGTGSWGESSTVNAGATGYGDSGLTCGTTYYYRVRAHRHSDGDYSNYSNIGSAITFPCLLNKGSPANGATGQPSSPTLSWGISSGATSYEYCFDATDDSTCGGSWTNIGTSTSAGLSGLSNSTTYYWQARARNDSGTTAANGDTWWSFTTQDGPLTGSLSGRVWDDQDDDQQADPDEPGVASITIRLYRSGTLLRTNVTESDGSYRFEDLTAGSYDVKEVQPSRLCFSTTPDHVLVTLTGAAVVNFGDWRGYPTWLPDVMRGQ